MEQQTYNLSAKKEKASLLQDIHQNRVFANLCLKRVIDEQPSGWAETWEPL